MIVYVSWESVNYNGSLIDISLCCVYCLGTSLFLFVGGESCVSIHLYIFIHSIYIIYIHIYCSFWKRPKPLQKPCNV